MKVLLLEDQIELGTFLAQGLREEGIECDWVRDGDDAFDLATARAYDALVLDIMVPGRDGLSILRELRTQKNNVPVILATARTLPTERTEGLNIGADDYMSKPLYLDELVARLRSLWRRSHAAGLNVVQVETLRINLMTREVTRGERTLDLTPREFSLLLFFAQGPGKVRTRTQILDQVWDYQFNPGTNLVDVYVRRLRKKVDGPDDLDLFETIRGVGYKLRTLPAASL